MSICEEFQSLKFGLGRKMGSIVSCLRPQTRSPIAAVPAVKRRQVQKSELARPPTKRLETIAQRALEMDKVGPPEMATLPTFLTPTTSSTAWVQLEGSFSFDLPPKPLSTTQVDKFKKQNDESKTLEQEIGNGSDDAPKPSRSEKSAYEKSAREALEAPGESKNKGLLTEEQALPEYEQNFDKTGISVDQTEIQEEGGSLFPETLSLKENLVPVQKEATKKASLRGAIEKFDELGRKATVRDEQKAKNSDRNVPVGGKPSGTVPSVVVLPLRPLNRHLVE